MTTASEVTMGDQPEEIPANCAAWLATHPEWAPIPGYANGYEASHRGNGVRSVDRKQGNRQLRGVNLKSRPNPDGYPVVNPTNDDGRKVPGMPVHTCVLLAHAGPPQPGMECLHGPEGKQDHRYCGCGDPGCTQGNIRYGTKKQNDAERIAALREAGRSGNGRPMPEPKPVRLCILCSAPVTHGGKRCHECVVKIGQEAAALIRTGLPLEEVAARLDYPSVSGVGTLAARYGRRLTWWHRAAVTLRGLFRGRRP